MIGSTTRQSSLFFMPLARQVVLLKDDLLEPVDGLLEDAELVSLVRQRLASRRPLSPRTGRRPSIAPDRLLRCCVLKHLKGWSFRELERELRSNLVYRRFTRFDADPTPNYSTFSRCFGLLGPDMTQRIHDRVVAKAREERVARGRKLRTDTTVVETNVHYPTDSALLGDGIRVLTRSLQRIAEQRAAGAVPVVNHARAAKRRLLEINRAAKSLAEASRQRLKDSYGGLLKLTRAVLRQAKGVVENLQAGRLPVVGSRLSVLAHEAQLRYFIPLVEKGIAQTHERVFQENPYVAGKVLSLFEPHTQAIRKGKAHKPTEFGRLVRLDEVENGIVSRYEVLEGNPADTTAWSAAMAQHQMSFGRPPRMATADRGYFAAKNERDAKDSGVEKVALPARGRLSKVRAKLQKERWFQRALRWRAGIEGRISTLKHPFSMRRATYKGDQGFERYVGWCVITQNLVSMARTMVRRKARADEAGGR
jgi:IS5 family transposase